MVRIRVACTQAKTKNPDNRPILKTPDIKQGFSSYARATQRALVSRRVSLIGSLKARDKKTRIIIFKKNKPTCLISSCECQSWNRSPIVNAHSYTLAPPTGMPALCCDWRENGVQTLILHPNVFIFTSS